MSDVLERIWRRFLTYAKVGVCLVLILFLFQSIAGGLGIAAIGGVLYYAGLVGFALSGAAGFAVAHEIRGHRARAEQRNAPLRRKPW